MANILDVGHFAGWVVPFFTVIQLKSFNRFVKNQLTVLIVEDEAIVGEIAARHLRKQGHLPLGPVNHFEEAVRCVTDIPVDLVLLDIHLRGGKSGIEVGHWLNEHHPNIPHAYLTGDEQPTILKEARKTAPLALLFKQLSPDSLRASLDVVLSNYRKRSIPETAISLSDGQTTRLVSPSEVIFVRTDHVYLHVLFEGHAPMLYRSSMEGLIRQFNSPFIVQTHRSYAINVNRVTAMDERSVWLGPHQVPISRRRRSGLKDQLARQLNL